MVNHGSQPASSVDVALELGGRAIQTQPLSIQPHGSAAITFDPVHRRGAQHARHGATGRRRARSATTRSTSCVARRVRPRRRRGARRNAARGSLYLSRALALGESPRVEVATVRAEALSADAARGRPVVVILNDVPVPDARPNGCAVRREGGGVLLALGDRATWPARRRSSFRRSAGAPVDRAYGAARPAGCARVRPSGVRDRSARRGAAISRRARFYGYRALTAGAGIADPGAVRRRGAGAAGAKSRQRQGSDVDVDAGSGLERSRGQAGVPAVRPPRRASPRSDTESHAPWRTVGEVVEPSHPTASPKASDLSRVAISPPGSA